MPKKKVTHFTLFVDEVLRPERLARRENPTFKQLLDEAFKKFPVLKRLLVTIRTLKKLHI